MRQRAIMWSVVVLLGSCRGGELPPQPVRSDAQADSELAHSLARQFAVAEVTLSRTAKVAGLSLVDSAFFRLPKSSRPARAAAMAGWTWKRMAHPAGITRFWIWASAPGPEDRMPPGVIYSYWTRDLETPATGDGHP
jgi:hypothetical protein